MADIWHLARDQLKMGYFRGTLHKDRAGLDRPRRYMLDREEGQHAGSGMGCEWGDRFV